MQQQKRRTKILQIWQNAQKHRQSTIVGIPIHTNQNQVCPCCDETIQKLPLQLCQHTKQFQNYGFGYPLWFSFLKYCIVLVLILIASKTATQIYMAAQQNYDFCYGAQATNSQNVHSNFQTNNSTNHENQNNIVHQKNNTLNTLNQQQKSSNNKVTNPHGQKNSQKNQSLPTVEKGNHPNDSTSELDFSIHVASSKQGEVKCTSFMVFLSIFKGQKMYDNTFLKIIEFCIHLFALLVVRNMILKQQQYYDQRKTLISNYSLIIHNLPNVHNLKRKIQNLFEQQFGIMPKEGQQSEIKQFLYVFKSPKLQQLQKQIKQKQDQLFQYKNNQVQNDQKQQKILNELKQLEQSLQKQTLKTRIQIQKDHIKCNKVIIVMATQGDKASVIYAYKQLVKQGRNLDQYFYDIDVITDEIQTKNHNYKPCNIIIKQAPEPNQIIWEHIDQQDKDRKLLIIQGWAFTLLFLGVITVIFYFILLAKTNLFISALQMEENDPNNQNAIHFKAFATFIVFVAIFGVVFFNKFLMGKVLHFFVHLQHHAYTDKQNHSFALKYALGMFFTTALMTLAVQALTYKNFYSHRFGVIQQETIMFFVTAFVIPLIWWIHPYNLMKNLKRKKYQNKKLISQKQANQLVQYYPYMLGKRYAEIFQIMWFTFLYSQLIPLGSFLVLIGLVLYYWVDKYNFLRRSAVNTRVSGKMAILGLKSLDATLFLSPAGQLLFSWLLRSQFDYVALVFTILGLIYLILPVTALIWDLNGQKFLITQKPYNQSKRSFRQNYHSLHPVYKHTHSQQILNHRQMFRQYEKQQMKKTKLYGLGRGNYRRGSQLQTKKLIKQNQLINYQTSNTFKINSENEQLKL